MDARPARLRHRLDARAAPEEPSFRGRQSRAPDHAMARRVETGFAHPRSSVSACHGTGPRDMPQRRCSSRGSSKCRATPAPSAACPAGPMSEPLRGAADTAGKRNSTSRKMTPGSVPSEGTGSGSSTGGVNRSSPRGRMGTPGECRQSCPRQTGGRRVIASDGQFARLLDDAKLQFGAWFQGRERTELKRVDIARRGDLKGEVMRDQQHVDGQLQIHPA